MAEKRWDIQKLRQKLQQGEDRMARYPLLELIADRRVLIENYSGICQYSPECIQIRVRDGSILVMGDMLELAQMDREHVVICGRVFQIQLKRECEA